MMRTRWRCMTGFSLDGQILYIDIRMKWLILSYFLKHLIWNTSKPIRSKFLNCINQSEGNQKHSFEISSKISKIFQLRLNKKRCLKTAFWLYQIMKTYNKNKIEIDLKKLEYP